MHLDAGSVYFWKHCTMEANLCKENSNSISPFMNIWFLWSCCFFMPLGAEETLQGVLEWQ